MKRKQDEDKTKAMINSNSSTNIVNNNDSSSLSSSSSSIQGNNNQKKKSSSRMLGFRRRSSSGNQDDDNKNGNNNSLSLFQSKYHQYLIQVLKIIIDFISNKKNWHNNNLFLRDSIQVSSSQTIIVEAVQSLINCIIDTKNQQINQNGGYSIDDILLKHVDDEGAFWATSIKIIIKSLPDPLIPIVTINRLVDGKDFIDIESKINFIKQVLSEIPFENWSAICELCLLLKSCTISFDDLKVSHLFCALLLTPQSNNKSKIHEKLMADIDAFGRSFDFIIKQADKIFDKDSAAALSLARNDSVHSLHSRKSSLPFDEYFLPKKPSNLSIYSTEGEIQKKAELKDNLIITARSSSLSNCSLDSAHALVIKDVNEGLFLFKAKALFDFDPEKDDELELRKGDIIEVIRTNDIDSEVESDWWFGRVYIGDDFGEGLFPKTYCEKIVSLHLQSPLLSNKAGNISYPSINMDSTFSQSSNSIGSSTNKSQYNIVDDLLLPVYAYCLYDFDPEFPDLEMKLYCGEKILILDRRDAEWWKGKYIPEKINSRQNQLIEGLFPKTYVELEKDRRNSTLSNSSQKFSTSSQQPQKQQQLQQLTNVIVSDQSIEIFSTGKNNDLITENSITNQAKIEIKETKDIMTNRLEQNITINIQDQKQESIILSTPAILKKEPSYKKSRPPAPVLPNIQKNLLPTEVNTNSTLVDTPLYPSLIKSNSNISLEIKNQPAATVVSPPTNTFEPLPLNSNEETLQCSSITTSSIFDTTLLLNPTMTDEEEAQKMGWIITPEIYQKYQKYYFDNAYKVEEQPIFATGEATGKFLLKSGLPKKVIARIMEICDLDRDQCFDCEEFAVAFHVAFCVKHKSMPLPQFLPPYLIPESKKNLPPPTNSLE